MEELTIISVLEHLMRERYFQCAWGMEWQEERQCVRITFQFELPNDDEAAFCDQYNMCLNSKTLLYETEVILYDPQRLQVMPTHVLFALPIQANEGIEWGALEALTHYLRNLTASVELKWHEFMEDSSQEMFELLFNVREYRDVMKRLKESGRYQESRIFFSEER